MNIPEKLAEAVARQDWQLVSDVYESLTGQALDLPEDRSIESEMIKSLEGFITSLRLGKAPMVLPVSDGKDVNKEIIAKYAKTTKSKEKKKTKTQQNTTTIDENLSDPVVNEADLYEPERGGHIEAARAGKVKVDKTKTELITCEADEEERAANAKKATPRKRRKKYQEFKYKCYRCEKEQKSPRCLSAENIKNFICDACGKGVIRRS